MSIPVIDLQKEYRIKDSLNPNSIPSKPLKLIAVVVDDDFPVTIFRHGDKGTPVGWVLDVLFSVAHHYLNAMKYDDVRKHLPSFVPVHSQIQNLYKQFTKFQKGQNNHG